MQPIETPRLHLRAVTLDDAEAYWPLVREPEVLRYTGETPQANLDAVRDVIRTRPLQDYQTYGYGRMVCIERSSGRLVGFSGLKFLPELNEVDIGYRFVADAWGKGYATESAQAVIAQQAPQFAIDRIVGLVMPQNHASARVLQKLGLRYEREFSDPGLPCRGHLYAASGFAAR